MECTWVGVSGIWTWVGVGGGLGEMWVEGLGTCRCGWRAWGGVGGMYLGRCGWRAWGGGTRNGLGWVREGWGGD